MVQSLFTRQSKMQIVMPSLPAITVEFISFHYLLHIVGDKQAINVNDIL